MLAALAKHGADRAVSIEGKIFDLVQHNSYPLIAVMLLPAVEIGEQHFSELMAFAQTVRFRRDDNDWFLLLKKVFPHLVMCGELRQVLTDVPQPVNDLRKLRLCPVKCTVRVEEPTRTPYEQSKMR